MDETLLIAAMVATGSILGPVLLSYLQGQQRRTEKKEEWARLDLVAQRAAEAAAAVVKSSALLIEGQKKVEDRVAIVAAVVGQVADIAESHKESDRTDHEVLIQKLGDVAKAVKDSNGKK